MFNYKYMQPAIFAQCSTLVETKGARNCLGIGGKVSLSSDGETVKT